MENQLHLVYSRVPDSVPVEEYDKWYDFHLSEILRTPGFVAARRYKLIPDVVEEQNPIQFTHLSLYETEGAIEDVMKALWDSANQSSMDLPDWFKEIHFASWNATSLGERVHESDFEERS
jgi:hypothetical protein